MKSLARFLGLLSWIAGICVAITLVVMLWLLMQTRSEMQQFRELESNWLDAAYELEINSVEISLAINRYWDGAGGAALDKIAEDTEDFERALKPLDAAATELGIAQALQQVRLLHARNIALFAWLKTARLEIDTRLQMLQQHADRLDDLVDAHLREPQMRVTGKNAAKFVSFEADMARYVTSLMLARNSENLELLAKLGSKEGSLRGQLRDLGDSDALGVVLPGALETAAELVLTDGRALHELMIRGASGRREQEQMRLTVDSLIDEQLQPAIARRMGAALEHANSRVSHALRMYSVLVVGLSSLWFICWRLLRKRIFAPIEALRTSLHRVGNGDLQERAVVLYNDEIGALAQSFNDTVATLSQQTIVRERLDHILDQVADYAIACDSANRITYASPKLLARAGFRTGALIGQNLSRLVGETQAQAALANAPSSSPDAFTIQELCSESGHWWPVHLVLTDLSSRDDRRYLLLGRDREADVAAAARLSWLQRLISNAQALLNTESEQRQQLELAFLGLAEREQSRIGQELHDDVGQQLAGVAFLARALHLRLKAAERDEATDANWIVELLAETLDSLRAISRDLSPSGMESGDLAESLQSLSSRCARLHGVSCPVTVRAADGALAALAPALSLNLFRITQESLNNALRHGQAELIEISLRVRATDGCLAIRDYGTGFDVGAAADGIGLRNIRMRTQALRGRARLRSAPTGTLVLIRFPIGFMLPQTFDVASQP